MPGRGVHFYLIPVQLGDGGAPLASGRKQKIISTLHLPLSLSARAITIPEAFSLQGVFITGELEVTLPEPHLGLKQVFSALKIMTSFKSVIAFILICIGHGEFMTKNCIRQ